MTQLDFSPKSTALLVMDCEEGVVAGLSPADRDRVLGNVGRAIQLARQQAMQVIYVVVQFREDYAEVSDGNVLLQGIKRAGLLKEGSDSARICAAIAPQQGDIVVTKRRISAFTGSDLALVLRSRKIDTLLLTGVRTIGVVESTAREAYDLDYRVVVLGDCCADRPEAHEAAIKWVLPFIALVASVEDLVGSAVK